LSQVAPFALEDQVSEDVERLHFALGKPRAGVDASTDVDVVSRARLEGWLAAAREAGIEPQAVHSLAGMVPVLPGQITLFADDVQLILRRDGQRPLVLPAMDPGAALELALGGESSPEGLIVTLYADARDWPRWEQVVEDWRPRLHAVHVQRLVQGVLPWLAAQGMQAPGINLLQGSQAPRRQDSKIWGRWRIAALLAACLLAVHLAGSLLTQKRLREQERALDVSIQQLFSQAMPGEVSGGKPRLKLEKRLSRLVAASPGREGFLPLASALVAATQGISDLQWRALEFSTGTLEATLWLADAPAAEHIAQALRTGGYAVRTTHGAVHEKQQEFRIQLKGAAP
jgi:general secretion pathway protein L